jgi:atypical dual specificity phosphatase
LVVLRNLMVARRVADRIVLLANGTIQEAGAADAFFAQPSSECGRLFLATGSCPEASRASADDAIEPLSDKDGDESLDKTVVAPHVSQAVGPRGFLWVLPGRLAGTPWPGIVQDVDYDLRALQAAGITHLVALTEQRLDDAVLARYGMGCTHSAMPDMQPPTEAQALELCQRMDHLLAEGETLAIHCRAGLGRTGTVLTAYWLWLGRGHRSALKALEDMRRIEPMWVQSQSQVDFLETFAACVARRALTDGAHNPVAGFSRQSLTSIKNQ